MPRARQSQSLARLRLMAVLVTALAGVACFKPRITEGGFTCGPGGVCPDGFMCDVNQGSVCVSHLSETGGAGAGGAGGVGGGAGLGGMGGEPTCFEPRPSCAPSDAGLCDPVCQTGCDGCRTKCSVNMAGTPTCNEQPVGAVKGLLEICTIYSGGQQTDNCAPGHVCLEVVCPPRCYQFCRNNQDCPNAACERQVGDGGQRVCDVPFKPCTPLGGNDNVGCAGGIVACYLSSSHPDQTLCDCPFGAAKEQEECKDSRDCNAGLACVGLPGGAKQCLRVCALANGGLDCPTALPTSCHEYKGSAGDGTPNSTYGYCR